MIICPYCGSHETKCVESITSEEQQIDQNWFCYTCGRAFVARYEFSELMDEHGSYIEEAD